MTSLQKGKTGFCFVELNILYKFVVCEKNKINALKMENVTTKEKTGSISPLLRALREQKQANIKGGIYHRVQVDMTYNSNHIEGSRLSHEQTRYIFETNTIGIVSESVNVDDIIETTNHFRAIDYIIDNAEVQLSGQMIKQLHRLLKSGTSAERLEWFAIGDYKKLPNEVCGLETISPEDVNDEMESLLNEYNSKAYPTIEDIVDFHYRFEKIHPFQDGNGRVGRLIIMKECLRCNHVPFIITNDLKLFYYRGLKEWPNVKGYLMDTCLTAQDLFKEWLDRFKIGYE